jgi:hypothetical protein
MLLGQAGFRPFSGECGHLLPKKVRLNLNVLGNWRNEDYHLPISWKMSLFVAESGVFLRLFWCPTLRLKKRPRIASKIKFDIGNEENDPSFIQKREGFSIGIDKREPQVHEIT